MLVLCEQVKKRQKLMCYFLIWPIPYMVNELYKHGRKKWHQRQRKIQKDFISFYLWLNAKVDEMMNGWLPLKSTD